LLGVNLPAQGEALGADSRITGKLAGWVVDGGKPGDLAAVLAAEAAPLPGPARRDRLQGTERGFGGVPGADDRLGHLGAPLADVHAGPGHELPGFSLRPPAERAGQLGGLPAPPSPSARAAGCRDDLMDSLVAEVQDCGEFAERSAAQVQAAHRAMKLSSGDLGSVLRLDEAHLRPLGLA